MHDDFMKLHKREILFKKWHENAYHPLREKIEKVVDKKYDEMLQQKRKIYADFLDFCNKKKVIFPEVFNFYHPC